MKFAIAEKAAAPRNQTVKIVAWVYVAVLVGMTVGQLFSFEKFIPLVQDYWLPGGDGTGSLVACLIVISQVFALPFLLRMQLSPLMRWFSLVCGFLAAGLWLLLGVVSVSGATAMTNSGILGTKVAVPTGMAQILWALVMAGLAGWSAWGLWPQRKK